MSTAELHRRIQKTNSVFTRRNVLLYACGVFKFVSGLAVVFSDALADYVAPLLLMVAAHFVVLWQVWKRFTPRDTSPQASPQASAQSALQFHRAELERQHGAVSRVWLWYIAPFMPAFVRELSIWGGKRSSGWRVSAPSNGRSKPRGARAASALSDDDRGGGPRNSIHPVDSIRSIGSGLFAIGPWGDERLVVNGRSSSLHDIEHGIVRPLWSDRPEIHYVLNCAAVGCPNLGLRAYTVRDYRQPFTQPSSSRSRTRSMIAWSMPMLRR